MDWLEFVSKSEWPVIVGGGLVMFRKSIAGLLQGLRPTKLKGFGIDAEFETALQKAEVLTQLSPPTPPADPAIAGEQPKPATPDRPSTPLAPSEASADAVPKKRPVTRFGGELSPGDQIGNTYRRLEIFIQSVWEARYGRRQNAKDIGDLASEIGFDVDQCIALEELRVLNDRVFSNMRKASQLDAYRFLTVANRLQLVASDLYGKWREEVAAKSKPPTTSPSNDDG